MEKKQEQKNSSLKTRFFGINPVRKNHEWLFELITLEESEDGTLEVIDRKGPYYMLELNTFLQIAIGKEKSRIFKELKSVD